ncbi:hypothetical protein Lal_00010088 [Lupinus albus]|nr:hypothetical protein Lal_00010088 [Lupinus albus]
MKTNLDHSYPQLSILTKYLSKGGFHKFHFIPWIHGQSNCQDEAVFSPILIKPHLQRRNQITTEIIMADCCICQLHVKEFPPASTLPLSGSFCNWDQRHQSKQRLPLVHKQQQSCDKLCPTYFAHQLKDQPYQGLEVVA